MPSPFSHALARDLAHALPSVATSERDVDRVSVARDLWPRHHLATRSGAERPDGPAVVAWPSTAEETSQVIRFAAARGVPVVPFGAGSGVCGGVLPSPDAIVLDTKRLGRVRDVSRDEMRVVVEAGVMGLPFEESLESAGLTLGHFPSSILCSTVGGWVATRSAGQASGYYGKIEDMVLAVECVDGTGELLRLPRRRYGADTSALVVGSEGALAVLTAATLRVHNTPIDRSYGGFTFRDVVSGLAAMQRMYQAGLRPAVCRLYDPFDARLARQGRVRRPARGPHAAPPLREAALRAVIASSSGLNAVVHGALGDRLLGGALLVLVFERAVSGAAADDLARARTIARELGGVDEGEGPARRWREHRYAVSFRQSPALRTGLFVDTFEVAAPWSRLGDVYRDVRSALASHAFVMAHFSHAYPDGCCIYFSFAGTAPRGQRGADFESASRARYDAAWRDGMAAAIAAGATVAHHHGVGRSKAVGAAREIEGGVQMMRRLRSAFDPQGILNPGVLVENTDAPAPARERATPPTIDEASLLARVEGDRPLSLIVEELAARGLALLGDVPATHEPVAEWLARGAPGAPDPFADPVDHWIAGGTVDFAHGRVVVPPVPRRATGPDFLALAVGAGDAFGARITSAWLRVAPLGASDRGPSRDGAYTWNAAEPVDAAEAALVARVSDALGRAS